MKMLSENAVTVIHNRAPQAKSKAVHEPLKMSLTQTTKAELAQKLGKSRATITRAIAKMTLTGRIRRIGSKKTGRWEV
jgi:predicted HTH transcriptional regulator